MSWQTADLGERYVHVTASVPRGFPRALLWGCALPRLSPYECITSASQRKSAHPFDSQTQACSLLSFEDTAFCAQKDRTIVHKFVSSCLATIHLILMFSTRSVTTLAHQILYNLLGLLVMQNPPPPGHKAKLTASLAFKVY